MEFVTLHLMPFLTGNPIIIIFILIILLLISIFGNIGVDWKEKRFTFGKTGMGSKRSCKDCIMLIVGKRVQFETLYNLKISTILRDQMNYVEHKFQEVTFELENTYRDDLLTYNKNECKEIENKEFILYRELLSNSLFETKDEIRRSFKENGFHDMNDRDFDQYIKDRSTLLLTIAREHIQRSYPSNMIIPIIERFKRYDIVSAKKIEYIIRDIYINAKEIRCRVLKELDELQFKFVDEVDSLVERKNS